MQLTYRGTGMAFVAVHQTMRGPFLRPAQYVFLGVRQCIHCQVIIPALWN